MCQRYTNSYQCRECAQAQSAQWIKDNPQRYQALLRGWRDINPSYHNAWVKSNPVASRAYYHRHRAKRKRAPGRHTPSDIRRIYKHQRGLCAYHKHCGSALPSDYHVDHIVPLARGGSNAANNLQLCCPDCNQRKAAKDPIDFARSLGALL